MSKMVLFLVVIIILFSVAAGGSWYLQYQQTKDADTSTAEEKPGKKSGDPKLPVKNTVGEKPPERPFARPSGSPDGDRFSQMASSLQAQQESLKNREQQVTVREKQMDIVHEEVKKEHKRLDLVRKEIHAELMKVEEKLAMLERQATDSVRDRKTVEAQKRELDQSILNVDVQEWANIKQQVKTFEKMDPEAAAAVVTQMVDSGKLDTAAKILHQVRDRQAAAIFAALAAQDAKLPVQILDRILTLKTPTLKTGGQ